MKRSSQDRAAQAADKLHLWAFMGNDKLHKRAFSMEKRIERLRKTGKPKGPETEIRFGEREFRGDEVMVIKDLKKSFGARTLFDHVDLEVEGGERIALLGDNGTGKSTLIKLILGRGAGRRKIRLGPISAPRLLPRSFTSPTRSGI